MSETSNPSSKPVITTYISEEQLKELRGRRVYPYDMDSCNIPFSIPYMPMVPLPDDVQPLLSPTSIPSPGSVVKVSFLDPKLKDFSFVPQTPGSAGVDLRACSLTSTVDQSEYRDVPDSILAVLTSRKTTYVSAGITLEIPQGYVGLIFPRSSSARLNIKLANTVGVIDSDYRGPIILAMKTQRLGVKGKWDEDEYLVERYERLAQLVVVPCFTNYQVVESPLGETERGSAGFGSTGKI